MELFVVRLWLPDRPGALGAVASRIGAVRGDVVGIDILERGAGRAIDELVVGLPDPSLVDLLVAEIGQVDGVDVEDVRPQAGPLRDHRLEALESAARLVETSDPPDLLQSLCAEVRRDYDADWTAVVEAGAEQVRQSAGDAPSAAWLGAFVHGSRSSEVVASGQAGPEDVVFAGLPRAGLELVVGRDGRPFRARERREVAALARIADRRWAELTG
ncbi:MAG: hypothetical protein IPM45_16805 [Acidimicrobiales bacterium]|nr:hypothetical protein [Acidimicrobiales bacterium]